MEIDDPISIYIIYTGNSLSLPRALVFFISVLLSQSRPESLRPKVKSGSRGQTAVEFGHWFIILLSSSKEVLSALEQHSLQRSRK